MKTVTLNNSSQYPIVTVHTLDTGQYVAYDHAVDHMSLTSIEQRGIGINPGEPPCTRRSRFRRLRCGMRRRSAGRERRRGLEWNMGFLQLEELVVKFHIFLTISQKWFIGLRHL